jgi:hypothetical protein
MIDKADIIVFLHGRLCPSIPEKAEPESEILDLISVLCIPAKLDNVREA